MENITYAKLTTENFSANSLDDFIRHQEVKKSWRKINDVFVLVKNEYVEDWSLEKRRDAERLSVSDKTVSKWETAKGYPDISLLEPIAKVFGISITELLAGNAVSNGNVSANMMRSKFYVCPVCGNAIHCMGEAVINCHGVLLTPSQAEETDENHMTKKHYISFVAALSADSIQMIKLYPEGNPEARFKINGVRQIVFYCNRDGLFSINVNKAIDGKENAYDDMAERRALEEAAKILFG